MRRPRSPSGARQNSPLALIFFTLTSYGSITNGTVSVSECGLNNQGISIGPVVAVSGEQAHALALALNYQAIAVVLDFMQPVGPRRNLGSARGNAGIKHLF